MTPLEEARRELDIYRLQLRFLQYDGLIQWRQITKLK